MSLSAADGQSVQRNPIVVDVPLLQQLTDSRQAREHQMVQKPPPKDRPTDRRQGDEGVAAGESGPAEMARPLSPGCTLSSRVIGNATSPLGFVDGVLRQMAACTAPPLNSSTASCGPPLGSAAQVARATVSMSSKPCPASNASLTCATEG